MAGSFIAKPFVKLVRRIEFLIARHFYQFATSRDEFSLRRFDQRTPDPAPTHLLSDHQHGEATDRCRAVKYRCEMSSHNSDDFGTERRNV